MFSCSDFYNYYLMSGYKQYKQKYVVCFYVLLSREFKENRMKDKRRVKGWYNEMTFFVCFVFTVLPSLRIFSKFILLFKIL